MATAKKSAAKNQDAENTGTEVPENEESEDAEEAGVRENPDPGVASALKGPSNADLNPAF